MADVPRLRAVYEFIRAHPREWDQGNWGISEPRCGTRHCVGGWTVVLGGGKLIWEGDPDHYAQAEKCRLPHRATEPIWEAAQRLLKLSDKQAHELFYGVSDLEDLKDAIDKIESGELV